MALCSGVIKAMVGAQPRASVDCRETDCVRCGAPLDEGAGEVDANVEAERGEAPDMRSLGLCCACGQALSQIEAPSFALLEKIFSGLSVKSFCSHRRVPMLHQILPAIS